MSTLASERAADRTAGEVLAWSRDLVEPALRAAVDTLPTSMRLISGYHLGWWDEHGRPVDGAGGKALRPALTLLSAEAVGAEAATVLPAAVAVELVHNFSLLHDDVMDGDATRRHRPTAWNVFGLGPAVLAGDALLALAFDVLAATNHPAAMVGARMLSTAVLDLVEGQSADVAFERRTDVGLAECVEMAERKTGALFGCSCALGGLFGAGSAGSLEQVGRLRDFGARLGLVFQHVDDLLGIWGDPAATGKPVHADLYQRKKSLPVVAALTAESASGAEAASALAALYHRPEPLTEPEVTRAADLVERAGGRSWSQAEADRLLAEALNHVSDLAAPRRATADLTTLSHLVARRDH